MKCYIFNLVLNGLRSRYAVCIHENACTMYSMLESLIVFAVNCYLPHIYFMTNELFFFRFILCCKNNNIHPMFCTLTTCFCHVQVETNCTCNQLPPPPPIAKRSVDDYEFPVHKIFEVVICCRNMYAHYDNNVHVWHAQTIICVHCMWCGHFL